MAKNGENENWQSMKIMTVIKEKLIVKEIFFLSIPPAILLLVSNVRSKDVYTNNDAIQKRTMLIAAVETVCVISAS